MLIELYAFFLSLAFCFMILSFYIRSKKGSTYNLIIPWLATSVFFFLGIVSYNIEILFCQGGSPWDCYTYNYTDSSLGYLCYGLGLMMLIYSIMETLGKGGKALEGQEET